MTSYEDLDGLIDQIAEEAINWQMFFLDWDVYHDGWMVQGMSGYYEVDRQGNVKNNGEPSDDPYYRDMMSGWRTTVREVLEPWTQLPDPAGLSWRVTMLRLKMNSLLDPAMLEAGDLDPEDAGVPTVGNGELHSARGTIETKLGNMEGYAAASMYDHLVTKMDDVMRGQFIAMAVLGQHLSCEHALLVSTREDITNLFVTLHEVMKEKGLVGGTVDLGLVGAIIGAAGAFATGGLATAIGILGAAVGLADELVPEGDAPDPLAVELGGMDPEESWGHMTAALADANEHFTGQEQDLATRSGNARDIVTGSSAFDLSKLTGEGTDPSALASAGDIIRIDEGGLRYVAEESLVTASHTLDQIRLGTEGIDPTFAMTRPASLGYASDGIAGPWKGLRDAITVGLNGTAGELWEMRSAVIDVLQRFGVTDVEQAERYREPEPIRIPGRGEMYPV